MSEHWSTTKEKGSVLGIKFLLKCYTWFGRSLLKILLLPIITFYYWQASDARQASKAYLKKILGLYPNALPKRKYSHSLGIKHFYEFGLAIIDKIDGWVGKIKFSQIRYTGREYAEYLFDHKQGAVFLTSHLGNMELCRAMSNRLDRGRINVLVYTKNAVKFNQVLKEMNPDVEVDLIQVSELGPDVAIMLKERIDNGEFVVIVGDRTSTTQPDKSVRCNFLGEPALFPMGPFILASLMECPVYLLFCVKEANRFHVCIEPFSEEPLHFPRKTRQQSLQEWAQKYADRLEYHCSQAPLQWFNFFDFWASAVVADAGNKGSK